MHPTENVDTTPPAAQTAQKKQRKTRKTWKTKLTDNLSMYYQPQHTKRPRTCNSYVLCMYMNLGI